MKARGTPKPQPLRHPKEFVCEMGDVGTPALKITDSGTWYPHAAQLPLLSAARIAVVTLEHEVGRGFLSANQELLGIEVILPSANEGGSGDRLLVRFPRAEAAQGGLHVVSALQKRSIALRPDFVAMVERMTHLHRSQATYG